MSFSSDKVAKNADTVVVLDFETTGLSPNLGDRAIEIGAVRLEQGVVTARFQKLMNPGFRVSSFIESYTGISNQMLRKAAPCEEVMAEFAEFAGTDNLVAHNASFDRRFLEAEWERIGLCIRGQVACSLLAARRIYQQAPSHSLGNLVSYKKIPHEGVFHRALADTEMTAKLWLMMIGDISAQYQITPVSFALMQQLSRQSKRNVHQFLCKGGSRS